MDKERVFAYLKKQKKADLLAYLDAAFDAMNASQRRSVFADAVQASLAKGKVDGRRLLKEVQAFHRASLSGRYYAPFDMNSKNFMHVPEETDEWCSRCAELLKQASRLTEQGDHASAVPCFDLLQDLVDRVDHGEEIIFAEEAGSWMIPIDEKEWTGAYQESNSAVTSAS